MLIAGKELALSLKRVNLLRWKPMKQKLYPGLVLLVLILKICVLDNNRSFCLVPEMLFIAFFVVLGTTQAADPAHLKPGALSAHLRRASLVEDIL